jgi:hypothetical protein
MDVGADCEPDERVKRERRRRSSTPRTARTPMIALKRGNLDL